MPLILPKISIVTPSFNQGEFIEKTILSVLAQDYPNIEYIIIDGGSTDNTLEIIKRYETRIQYWVSEPDKGQSHAINKGFQKASGQIFYWINSDDIMLPSSASIAVYHLMKHPSVGMVYGDRIIIDNLGNVLSFNQFPKHRAFIFKYCQVIPQETTFFREELWTNVHGLDETKNYCMDADLWLKFSKVTKMLHVPFFLGCYRAHSDSKSINTIEYGEDQGLEEVRQSRKKHFGTLHNSMYSILHPVFSLLFRILLRYDRIRKEQQFEYSPSQYLSLLNE